MTATVTAIWRHPIKAHGSEQVDRVTLREGKTMPWDRFWAVAHEQSKIDGATWAPCVNFSRGSKVSKLVAMTCTLDTETETVTLSHPDLPDLIFRPDYDADAFLDWVRPIMPENRAASARIVRAPGRGMTDSDFASVSLCNMASLRDLSDKIGKTLTAPRFRGNIWFDGAEAWSELDWLNRRVRIGTTELQVRQRTERCNMTTTDPETGQRDLDTLGTLNREYGHQDFGVYAMVIKGGEVAVGDALELL